MMILSEMYSYHFATSGYPYCIYVPDFNKIRRSPTKLLMLQHIFPHVSKRRFCTAHSWVRHLHKIWEDIGQSFIFFMRFSNFRYSASFWN